MEGPPPPLKLGSGKRKFSNVLPSEGPPPALSFGSKKPKTPSSRNSPAYFNPRDCGGGLAADERCVLRVKKPDEVYSSYIYEIYKDGSKEPVTIRKLATSLPRNINNFPNIEAFLSIRNEGKIYEALKEKAHFSEYCLPYLRYKDVGQKRFIDFTYVKGDTLQDYVHRHKLSKVARRILLAQCIKCLLFLLNHGYIHGDIKMDNFWWDSEAAKVRIFDFELARENPPILNRHKGISLFDEANRFVNLVNYEHEFGFSGAETRDILGGDRDTVLKKIEDASDAKEGMTILKGIYETALRNLAAAPKGGARRTTRRKNRRSQ